MTLNLSSDTAGEGPTHALAALAQAAAPQPSMQAAPAPAAPAAGEQALVPIGIPTAAPTTASESQPLPGPGGRPASSAPDMTFLFLMVGLLLFMIFMAWSGSRREKKKRAELNAALKKGDTVQMLGGIIGTIGEMRDDEVVVKVEEGRIRFARSAVQAILKPSKDVKAEASVEAKSDARLATSRS